MMSKTSRGKTCLSVWFEDGQHGTQTFRDKVALYEIKKGQKSNLAIAKKKLTILISNNCLKFSNAISVDARLAMAGQI